MSKDKRAIQKLRREVEKTKRALSSTHQARLEIEALFDGVDFSESLTRARFEELNADLFKKTLGPVKNVMDDSGLKKTQVDEVVSAARRVSRRCRRSSRTSSTARSRTAESTRTRLLHTARRSRPASVRVRAARTFSSST